MKKIVVMLLSVILALSVVGCGKTPPPNTVDSLIIEVIEAGYGTNFVNKMAEEYLKTHEGKEIHVRAVNKLGELAQARINTGPKNATDLYFSTSTAHPWRADLDKGSSIVSGCDTIFADISEVFDYKPDGGSKTVRDKMSSEVKSFVSYKDANGVSKDYVIPWAKEATGLVYNQKMFDDNTWSVPRTTKELTTLASTIKSNGKVPFIWSGDSPYWQYLYKVWWAQYEGETAIEQFFKPVKIDDFTGQSTYTPDYFDQQGRKKALELTAQYVDPANSFTNCSTLGFSLAQGFFLSGKAAMMPTGGWLENEMKASNPGGAKDFKMMKTPVISDIIDRLGSINDEATLTAVIDYVDSGKTTVAPSGVTEADILEIEKARKIVCDPGAEHIAFIPEYSNAKELAKDFLKFFYSNAGSKIFMENSRAMPVVEFDYQASGIELSPFETSRFNILENSKPFYSNFSDKIFYKGGLNDFYGYTIIEKILGASNASDRKSGAEVFEQIKKNVNDSWSTITSFGK